MVPLVGIMGEAGIVLVVLGGWAVALLALSRSRGDEDVSWELRGRPRQPIGAFVEEAEGCILGRVSQLTRLLRSPMTGRDCVAYTFCVYRHGGARVGWKKVLDLAEHVPFAVDDTTGRAVAAAGRPCLWLRVDRWDQSDSLCPAGGRVREILRQHGFSSVGASLRYEEGILVEGEMVTVLGVGRRRDVADLADVDSQQRYRERARCLVMSERADGYLVISNEPSALA